MANICSIEIEITSNVPLIEGQRDALSELDEKINKQDPTLLTLFPWFEWEEYYGASKDRYSADEYHIYLNITSKWNFPLAQFKNLVVAYPELEFSGMYLEPSMAIYGDFQGSKGLVIHNSLDIIEFFSKHDEDFQNELHSIESRSYQDLIKYAATSNYLEEIEFCDKEVYQYLEDQILDRVKDRDLPLLMSRRWVDDCKYKDRFDKISIKKEEK